MNRIVPVLIPFYVVCYQIYEDKISGVRTERPGLVRTLEMLREGDTLVVWKLDRLGRSVKQLVDMGGVWETNNIVRQACFLNRLSYLSRVYSRAIGCLAGLLM